MQLSKRASTPYSLNSIISLATATLVLLLAIGYSAFAHERLARETLDAVKAWSTSVAQLVASNNTSAYILSDLATIESNLQQVALLPGIVSIAVFRADGRNLAEVKKTTSGLTSSIATGETIQVPSLLIATIPDETFDDVHQAWAAMNLGASAQPAWVRVQFSLNERKDRLSRLWSQSLAITVFMVGLILVCLHLIVRHALRSVTQLSQFAEGMSQRVGSRIDIKTDCLEASRLATALNRASEGIAEQIAKVQAIVSTAVDAIIGLDRNGSVVMANPAAERMFGLTQEALLGRPLAGLVPDLRPTVMKDLLDKASANTLDNQRKLRGSFVGVRADGGRFPIEVSLGDVSNNQTLQHACIIRDVTEERAAQENLLLYARALACSHNGVFITNAKDFHQPIVYVNEAFEKVTGMTGTQVLGESLEILGKSSDHGSGIAEIARAVAEKRNTAVTLYKSHEDGSQQVAEVSIAPVSSPAEGLTHFVGIISDVTARVNAEKAMTERTAQLNAIFSLSPDGFVLFSSENQLMFANPAFDRITGESWTGGIGSMTMQAFEEGLASLCDSNAETPNFHLADQNTDQTAKVLHLVRPQVRIVQVQVKRNWDGRGETVLYFRDITHESEVDRMKSEFLTTAAHELRTPMVSILGFAELLMRRKFTPERQADMFSTIHRQSSLLVNMINELLDLARIEARGGLDLNIAPHGLTELIGTTVDGLMRPDGDRQVEVSPLPLCKVLVDPAKMQLAISNLLSNAFKYSPGGGSVCLSAREQRDPEGREYAVIQVADQGIGLTPEQLEHVFDRFYRADSTGNIPGSGLGLSLVKEIAELHGGKVELESTYGKGTTATLWVPLERAR